MNVIRSGDTVMVAFGAPCCGHPGRSLGRIYTVKEVIPLPASQGEICANCGVSWTGALIAISTETGQGAQLERLVKLPPLTEETPLLETTV